MSSKIPFEELITIAQRNAKKGEKKAQQKVFPVISKPKKLDPKEKKLTEGIKKFLEQKNKEEKQKQLEAQAKRHHLEELRSQTKGANRRVGQMLRMTKSANKACIADAQSCLNDSLAAQGECQPDEDDYGYVSQSAQAWHQKLMTSYKSIPVNNIVRKPAAPIPEARSLNPSRVVGSSRENKSGDTSSKHEEYVPESKPEKVSAKRKLPPPPNFQDLIAMAAQKSKEPVPIIKPVVQKNEGPEFEYGRPMTAKEKAAYQQEKSYRERIEKGLCTISNSETNKPVSTPETPTKTASFKIPNKRAKTATQNTPPPPPKASSPIPNGNSNFNSAEKTKVPNKADNIKQKDYNQRSDVRITQTDRMSAGSSKYENRPPGHVSSKYENRPPGHVSSKYENRPPGHVSSKYENRPPGHVSSKYENRPPGHGSSPDIKVKIEPESSMHRAKTKEPDLSLSESKPRKETDSFQREPKFRKESESSIYGTKIKKETISSANGVKIKKEPDSSKYETKVRRDVPIDKPRGSQTRKEFPNKPSVARNNDERSNEKNPRPNYLPKYTPEARSKMAEKLPRGLPPNPYADHLPAHRLPSFKGGRAVINSDEEYDSEMDDFIDDSEVDMRTISNEISQIFNYRRDKYVDEDSDDECMESSVAQQMMEEKRSLMIGMQEDKEEEMKEKAEEARKRKLMLERNKNLKGKGKPLLY